MKTKFYLILFTFLFSYSIKGQIVTDSLIAYYPFDSLLFNDVSGNGSNGVAIGNITAVNGRKGEPMSAIKFEEQSEILLLGTINNIFDPASSLSISFWYKNYSLPTDDYEIILKKDEVGTIDAPNHLSIGIYTDNKIFNSQTEQTNSPTDPDEWNHVLTTYDNGNRALYINGVLQSTSTEDFTEENFAAVTLGTQSFTGALDELIFYEKVLSFEEITSIFEWDCVLAADEIERPLQAKIFPNPSTDFIQVEVADVNYSLELFDINGSMLLKKVKNLNSIETINLNNFANGVYILIIKNEAGKTLQRELVFKQ